MSTVAESLVTVDEFLRLPEPKSGHAELHHGEVVLGAPPKWGHEEIQDRITQIFKRMFGDRGTVRMEMGFRPSPEYEYWRADVGLVAKERAERTGDDEYLQGAPDLVVEVLSPSNTMDEISDKMHVCLEHGCSSFWVINPKHKEVEITGTDFVTRRFKAAESIQSDLLGGAVRVEEIFQ